jgi:hypothetical protein
MIFSEITNTRRYQIFQLRGNPKNYIIVPGSSSGEFIANADQSFPGRCPVWKEIPADESLKIIKAAPENIVPCAMYLTSRQKDEIRALLVLKQSYLAADKDGRVFAYRVEPVKHESEDEWRVQSNEWGAGPMPIFSQLALFPLVRWSDNSPLQLSRALLGLPCPK